jgi:uncharacterized protein YdhG (YjbR/CyaY superfamily)
MASCVLTELRARRENGAVSQQEIDRYLAELDEPKRTTLGQVRDSIAGVIPEAEQCISYGTPAFRVQGKVIAGFAAFKNHLSYLPHSGSVLPELRDELSTFSQTKGALHFPIDEPLSRELVQQLIAVRMRQAFGASSPAAHRA